jgi:hypothetical protein
MKMRPPRSIIFVAAVFILAGSAGLLNDWWPLLTFHAAEQLAKLQADGVWDLGLAWSTRLLAIVGGVGLLRGHNWARWLLLAWMLFHVGISFFHSLEEVLLHTVIFAPLSYLIFRRSLAPFFQPEKAASA